MAAFAFVGIIGHAVSETVHVAIEDKDWKPYYFWIDGKPQGACVDVASAAIKKMGAQVKWVRMPWARVLRAVERKKVDAGLCGTFNKERAAYSYYPKEPLLSFDATLFARHDSILKTSSEDALKGKSFGMIKGYNYGEIDKKLEARGMIRFEVLDRRRLLKMLSIGRIDTVLDSILPTMDEARALGYDGKIRTLLPSLSKTPGYVFFSRKAGNDKLAERFSRALAEFKKTPAFTEIRNKYGY